MKLHPIAIAVALALAGAAHAQDTTTPGPTPEAGTPGTTQQQTRPQGAGTIGEEGAAGQQGATGQQGTLGEPGAAGQEDTTAAPATVPPETDPRAAQPGEPITGAVGEAQQPDQMRTAAAGAGEMALPKRVSELIGTEIVDAQGTDVGEIEDVVIDETGQITHAVVSYGGTLGLGESLTAVPWEQVTGAVQGERIVMEAERIEGAPTFAGGDLPETLGADWSAEVDRYWQQGAAAGMRQAEAPTTTAPVTGAGDAAGTTGGAVGAAGEAAGEVTEGVGEAAETTGDMLERGAEETGEAAAEVGDEAAEAGAEAEAELETETTPVQ